MVQKRKITLKTMKWTFTLTLLLFGLIPLSNKELSDYPVPTKSDEMLFYIQRNHNKNTIVYDANFDNEGQLIASRPIDVYWIRYEEDSRRMELRNIEKMFAYGVKCEAEKLHKNQFIVKMAAAEDRSFRLIQKAPFRAEIQTLINNEPSVLEHMYIFADNSGFWPKVDYIELFGKNRNTGNSIYEKIDTN